MNLLVLNHELLDLDQAACENRLPKSDGYILCQIHIRKINIFSASIWIKVFDLTQTPSIKGLGSGQEKLDWDVPVTLVVA